MINCRNCRSTHVNYDRDSKGVTYYCTDCGFIWWVKT